jgi:aryl-alcohol dehydrogenase
MLSPSSVSILNPGGSSWARELGATQVIDNSREDVVSQVRKITGSGVDYVLEITGAPAMYQLAIEILNPGGAVALIARPGGSGPLPGGRRALGIIQGDAVSQDFIPKMISLYQAGQFPIDRLEKCYDFQDINLAIAEARRGDVIKPVLRISRA